MWPIVAATLIGVCLGFLGGLALAYLLIVPLERKPRYESMEPWQRQLRIVK